MDTNESTAPVGEAGATASPDTATTDIAQTSQTEAGVSDAQSGSEGEASLLAGKYKNAQELEKAYLESQKKISEYGQKATVADMIQEKYGLSPEQFRDYVTQQEQMQQQQMAQQNPGLYALQQTEALRQQIESEKALMAEEKKLDDFIKSTPEAEQVKDKLMELALTNPKYVNDDSVGYDQIYNDWFGQSRAQGQQDAYKKIETKVMTQATGASTAGKKQISADDLKSMSTAEMESILPHA